MVVTPVKTRMALFCASERIWRSFCSMLRIWKSWSVGMLAAGGGLTGAGRVRKGGREEEVGVGEGQRTPDVLHQANSSNPQAASQNYPNPT